jgi:hypothetical protein
LYKTPEHTTLFYHFMRRLDERILLLAALAEAARRLPAL